MFNRAETIAANAQMLRAVWPDRAERKARCAHIRNCGGLIGSVANHAAVALLHVARDEGVADGAIPHLARAGRCVRG